MKGLFSKIRINLALLCYFSASYFLQLCAPLILQLRLYRQKEDRLRYREKLGFSSQHRPQGELIWLHAVGVGEVLTVPIVIEALLKIRPQLQFLITSTSKTSATAIANNMPPQSRHQYLPLDYPRAIKRFTRHWQPQLSVWVEQDLWPGIIHYLYKKQVPLALINVRMHHKSFVKKCKIRSLFYASYQKFNSLCAQDKQSQINLQQLSQRDDIAIAPSLKRSARQLQFHRRQHILWQNSLAPYVPWVAASIHLEELAIILEAHQKILKSAPNAILILVPRYPRETLAMKKYCTKLQLATYIHSAQQQSPEQMTDGVQVVIAATIGELGLWYRLVKVAFIGGSFCRVEGHNPFEAIALECFILSGPQTQNFAADYADIYAADIALCVQNAEQLAQAVLDDKYHRRLGAAQQFLSRQQQYLTQCAHNLVQLLVNKNL